MSWIDNIPELSVLPAYDKDLLNTYSAIQRVPKDTIIFGPGKKPDSMLLLLRGTVRVQQFSRHGREIVLYRVFSGESCVLTTSCLLAFENYSSCTMKRFVGHHNVSLHPNFCVGEVNRDGLISTDGQHIPLAKSIWCTGAAAATWLSKTGLKTSDKGFIFKAKVTTMCSQLATVPICYLIRGLKQAYTQYARRHTCSTTFVLFAALKTKRLSRLIYNPIFCLCYR